MFQTSPQTNRAEAFEFIGTGVVYSYTVVQDPPAGYQEQAPYILALVRLDEGAIVTAQLTDVDTDIAIGDPVEMVTRKLTAEGKQGTIVYGYKFRPTLSA